MKITLCELQHRACSNQLFLSEPTTYFYPMKNTIYILLVFIALLISCNSKSNAIYSGARADTTIANDTIRIANDSLEYEIIIIEPGFNGWLATQPPRGYYTQSAMEISNNFKVLEYNLRTRDPIRYGSSLYVFPIDYDRTIDYGYEVNYLLFNYFLFFEQRYNQKLR